MGTLSYVSWPNFDANLARDETQEYVVQVNGKVKHRFQAEAGLPAEALIAVTKAEPEVIALLHGKTIVREIAIPGRLTNFVLR